jgi:hypothetical protein
MTGITYSISSSQTKNTGKNDERQTGYGIFRLEIEENEKRLILIEILSRLIMSARDLFAVPVPSLDQHNKIKE